MVLLDSNAMIALLNERPRCVRTRYDEVRIAGRAIATSALVVFELGYGALRSQRRERNATALRLFLSSNIEVLPFDAEDAATAAEIRAHLAAAGTPIGPYDLLIAAQALRRDATLITANLAEFRRVPGLKCLNWAAS